jgi:hypothetical protein
MTLGPQAAYGDFIFHERATIAGNETSFQGSGRPGISNLWKSKSYAPNNELAPPRNSGSSPNKRHSRK